MTPASPRSVRSARSMLFVPASRWAMIVKAAASDADSVCIDLEDSVPTDQKAASRANVVRAFTELDFGLRTRMFRMNAVDTSFAYDFADPIFRLGNDYSRGIILATGYVGQRISNGLVTCLTDGHPGVSGGGVLDQRGDLVGIPIGRMLGDYRFSFILPIRPEMFRKLPSFDNTERIPVPAQPQ